MMNHLRLSLFVVLLAAKVFAAEIDSVVDGTRQFVIESIKTGRAFGELGPFGKVKLVSGDELGVEVQQSNGGNTQIKWNQLTDKELFRLSRNLLKEDDLEGHLQVARMSIKAGLGVEMDKALERLELAKPHAYGLIERVRCQLIPEPPPPPRKPTPQEGELQVEPKKVSAVAGIPKSAAQAPAGKNHDGRLLPPLPKFDRPILFNTPEADAIVSAMQIFPSSNPWNEDISKHPVHPDSAAIINSMGPDGTIGCNDDMCYVIVPPNQPKLELKKLEYPGESDKGPYPIPDNAPIEGWPLFGGELEQLQRHGEGDRHVLIVDPWNGLLYEFFVGRKTDAGWTASQASIFNLRSNKTRPEKWTSADAAGLPIFPAAVRYDECERGMVEHALRVTVRRTRKEFIWPATHYASRITDKNVPAMGQRLRLKAEVDISRLPKHAKAVALAMKKYGMFVADNGSNWRISTAPDSRLQGLRALRQLKGSDFEVIQTTPREAVPDSK